MRITLCFLAVLLAGSTLRAQSQAESKDQNQAQSQAKPADQAKPAQPVPEVLKPSVYVRRFSFGLLFGGSPFTMVPKRDVNPITTVPPIDAYYATTDQSGHITYGATAQLAITERMAVNATFLIRKFGYTMSGDIYTGVNNPATLEDERTHIDNTENTTARLYDVPVVLRFYSKDRHDSGIRGFLEAGAAIRHVTHVRTSIDTQTTPPGAISATDSCCDTTPARIAHQNAPGIVAGVGFQVIDPVGIRVVPEIRYIRWLSDVFSNQSTSMQRNQLEVTIALTF